MYIVNLEIQLERGSSKIFRKFYSFAFKLFALSMHLGEKIHFLSDIWIKILFLNPVVAEQASERCLESGH